MSQKPDFEISPEEYDEAFMSLMKRLKAAGIIKRLPRKGSGDDSIAFNPAYEKPLGGEGWMGGFCSMFAVVAKEGPLSPLEQMLLMKIGDPEAVTDSEN